MNYSLSSASRLDLTFCAAVRFAVSITRCSRSHAWYSREATSSQVGGLNLGMLTIRVSTLRRCSLASGHVTSISRKLAAWCSLSRPKHP
jgi:hypothetical protein